MMDFICEYILPIFLVILTILAIVVIGMIIYNEMQINNHLYNYLNKKDYIQNLEEKVNILTQDYENFALEDSLRQVE